MTLVKKIPFYEQKNLIINGNVVNDDDYFMIKMHKKLPSSITKNTYDKIQRLFDKYTYQYNFKREDVEEMFGIKKSRASEILALLLDCDLIEQSQSTKYKFKK